jgi:hypothetical protein
MGTEAFWIPAAIAAVGSGVQYANQNAANSRQQSAEVQSILDQQRLQQQGNGQVKALTAQIAQNTPDQLAAQATGKYVDVLRRNAAGTQQGGNGGASILFGQPTSSLPTNLNADPRYKSDIANSQNQVESFGNELAGEMGNIDAATRQRQNEGLAMNTLGTNLNLLGAQSYTQNFADQLRAQAAGQQSPWLSLLGGVLQKGGQAAATAGLFSGASPMNDAGDLDSSGASIYGGTSPSGFLNQGGYLVNPWG